MPDTVTTIASVDTKLDPADKSGFSLEYVQELRGENAAYRNKAKEAKAAADAAEARLAEAEAAATQRIIRAELKAEAIKAGLLDLDGLKLADLSAVALDEHGEVSGAADVLHALKQAKPYLFGAVGTTSRTQEPPKQREPKPFDARTATAEERAAKAKEMRIGVRVA